MGVEKVTGALEPFPLVDYKKTDSCSARLEVELELIEGISTFTPDLYRLISVWLDEWAVRDELRIHYADLDPAVGSTRLVAVRQGCTHAKEIQRWPRRTEESCMKHPRRVWLVSSAEFGRASR